MNKGIARSTGDYVLFINSGDTLFCTDTIDKIFENYQGQDVFYGNTLLVNSGSNKKLISRVPKELSWKSFVKGMVVSHQSIIIRKALVMQYNLTYKIVSDQDWVINSLKNAKLIENTEGIISCYLLGGFASNNFFSGWKERFDITYRQYGIFALFNNLFLFGIATTKRTVKGWLAK
jgi:hypothetical protein